MVQKDGVIWIALKPLCEAIGINYKRAHSNLMTDPILGPASSNQRMQIIEDQSRYLTCLPENLIYGWIFSIESKSPSIVEYKRECYDVLFNHFHGAITRRSELIIEKAKTQQKRIEIEKILGYNEKFVLYNDLKAKEARIGKAIKEADAEEIANHLELFPN